LCTFEAACAHSLGIPAANSTTLYAPTWDFNAFFQNPTQTLPSALTVVDLGTNRVVDGDPSTPDVVDGVPVGAAPLNVAVSPDGSVAYVLNVGDGTVAVIDTVTNKMITTFPYGDSMTAYQNPNLMGISPDGKQMYISKYGTGTITAVRIV
jgi:YVTN family beta-propeller protein